LGRNEIFLRIFDDLRPAMAYQVGGMEKDPLSGWYQSKRAWPDNFDTAILIGNRYALNDQGKPKVFLLAVDAWQMGWTPTAFLMALVLATPISWQRRLWSLLLSLLCVHSFILLTVGISIWNESTRISLVTLTPFWKAIANQVEDLALDPVGPSFFAAALIWILVSFGRQDFTCLPQH